MSSRCCQKEATLWSAVVLSRSRAKGTWWPTSWWHRPTRKRKTRKFDYIYTRGLLQLLPWKQGKVRKDWSGKVSTENEGTICDQQALEAVSVCWLRTGLGCSSPPHHVSNGHLVPLGSSTTLSNINNPTCQITCQILSNTVKKWIKILVKQVEDKCVKDFTSVTDLAKEYAENQSETTLNVMMCLWKNIGASRKTCLYEEER